MRLDGGGELPRELEPLARRARRLEWVTLAYLASAVFFIYLTLGSSQSMKAAWIEDMLSLVPPIAFLIAARFRTKAPTPRFAWGYHRAISVAYLTAALALLAFGLFLLYDSALKLLKGEHPTIGLVEVLGVQLWLGWLMLAALLWSAVPAVVLGHLKKPLAEKLHDKVLYADAKMNKADWMTAGAAMLGVLGIGIGLWWADAVAAIVIAADIIADGQRYTRKAVADLVDSRPTTFDEKREHPLTSRVEAELAGAADVREAVARLRELGHVFSVNVWLVPERGLSGDRTLALTEEMTERLRGLDWKIQDVVVSAVASVENVPEGALHVDRA